VSRIIHPIYKAVESAEAAWARDRQQAWQRTVIVVCAMFNAGMLSGGYMEGGLYHITESDNEKISA
jgi:hypothetical protein